MGNHMAIRRAAPGLDAIFGALSDPTRRGMIALLAGSERSATELGARFRISQPAASKHIRTLERAGLVARRVEGRVHRFSLRAKPLQEAEAWIARHRKFWEASLESLDRLLTGMEGERRD